jgi:tripartite-type tricarboxylate transporter receptor subunit TctC
MGEKTTYTASLLMLVLVTIFYGYKDTLAQDRSFFKGKTIRIVVGNPPGGGFDTFARLVARHIAQHIPGRPSIVVQNMPGAGGLVAANQVYSIQPGEGLTIVTFNAGILTRAVVGDPRIKFDPSNYAWLGDPTFAVNIPRVLWIRSELPYRSVADLRGLKQPISLGATVKGTGTGVAAEFLRYLDYPINIVYGYGGSARIMAAIERKELDGMFLTQVTMQSNFGRFIDEGIVRPIFAMGQSSIIPPLPGVSTLDALKLSGSQKALAEFIVDNWALLRLYALPPGVPSEREALLEKAFLATLKSQQFADDAKRLEKILNPISGKRITGITRKLKQTPAPVLAKYKELVGMK